MATKIIAGKMASRSVHVDDPIRYDKALPKREMLVAAIDELCNALGLRERILTAYDYEYRGYKRSYRAVLAGGVEVAVVAENFRHHLEGMTLQCHAHIQLRTNGQIPNIDPGKLQEIGFVVFDYKGAE